MVAVYSMAQKRQNKPPRAILPSKHSQGLDTVHAIAARFPLLTADEEKVITTRYYKLRRKADFDLLVNSNLRYVIACAMKFIRYGHPLTDLVQEGTLGLMRAVEKFDPSRPIRLVSYAGWWINAYLRRYIVDNYSQVRIGKTNPQRQLFFVLLRAQNDLKNKLQREPTHQEIADRMGNRIKLRDVEIMLHVFANRELSMDLPLNGSELSLGDALQSNSVPQDDQLIECRHAAETKNRIEQYLWRLSRVEAKVVRMRLLQEDPAVLREVGEKLGFSRERARQIEQEAIAKLRKMMLNDGFTGE